MGTYTGCNPDIVGREKDARIAQLEGDLSVACLQLQRIDEALVGHYGDIENMNVKVARGVLRNIAYIINPTHK